MSFEYRKPSKESHHNDACTYGVQMSTSEEVEVKMSFEDLRKRARQLESEIDVKLVSFSKIAASYGSSSAAINTNPESVSLLSGDQMYETISVELEQLLTALTDINERMNNCPHGSSVATIHTLQRHRDILQDYTHEFQRTNNTIKSRREREQLLGTGRNGGKSLAGLSRRDLYLKESEHLVNSEGLVDEQITIAMDTRDHLKTQRQTFKMIQTKVNDLSNRFPMVNSLMTKINIRKRRDSLILGTATMNT
ncbi:Golgi SNAP receptor complex member 1 [Portunus trituberculatus]|uniref:Golgi SNAP receptor complex member 1 n=1 Tax=Portunus trituberculatus TaxID=210409 RepID=A0A5B7DLD1_PORTR|nr:Golgi SNAP receptor complex member 1 [Portunus trituberculatus]